MRFTAQQISDIVAFIDSSSFDTLEAELPEVLVLSQYADEDDKYEREDVVYEATQLARRLEEKFPFVQAVVDNSTTWIYIYLSHK